MSMPSLSLVIYCSVWTLRLIKGDTFIQSARDHTCMPCVGMCTRVLTGMLRCVFLFHVLQRRQIHSYILI